MFFLPSKQQLSTAQQERQALADLLLALGEEAPTLCAGWTTKDLLVHLVIREYRPDAAAGMFIKPLSAHLGAVTRRYSRKSYPSLVEQFRSGPPWWSALRYVDRYVNLLENFIHHEDVLRAIPDAAHSDMGQRIKDGLYNRELSSGSVQELWAMCRRVAPIFLRSSRVRVVLECSDSYQPGAGLMGQVSVGSSTLPEVRIRGAVGELLLWMYGRDDVARVSFYESTPGAREKIRRVVL